jgi:hypothetical protein
MLAAEEDFSVNVREIEKQLLKEINKLFEVINVVDGKLQNSEAAIEFLATIEKRIDAALKKSGYNSAVMGYLKNFDAIRRNNLEIQSLLNKAEIPYSSLSAITRLEVENTIDKLLGAGISRDFKFPIREALYRNITLGTSIQDAKQTIASYIISNDGKDSKLLRYTTQVARDSISQYDGSIQTVIKNELGLKDFIYSGSIIADSRCQCRYWVNKQKLPHEELITEIETALDGGQLGGCTCSGMIPGTNIHNFAVNRGGYSCRHRSLDTNL